MPYPSTSCISTSALEEVVSFLSTENFLDSFLFSLSRGTISYSEVKTFQFPPNGSLKLAMLFLAPRTTIDSSKSSGLKKQGLDCFFFN